LRRGKIDSFSIFISGGWSSFNDLRVHRFD
jgi:hypothetical protein